MQTEEKTLRDWDHHIQEAEQNLALKKQECDEIINDPSVPAERKAEAIKDIAAQEEYLKQLKEKKAELAYDYAHGIPFPDTINFNVQGAGLMCKDSASAIHQVSLNGAGAGTSLRLVLTDFFEFNLVAADPPTWEGSTSYTGFNSDSTVYAVGTQATGGTVPYQYNDGYGYIRPDAQTYTLYENRTLYICAKIVEQEAFNPDNIPTIGTATFFSPFIANVSGVPTEPVAPNNNYIALGVKFDYGSHSVDTETPWDYFNDYINPDLNPDDSMFPDGYEPTTDSSDESPLPDTPVPGPDKNDRGDKGLPKIDAAKYPNASAPFVQYGVFKYQDLVKLSEQLWNKPENFFEGLSAAQKVNPMDFFISLRWYPVDLEPKQAEPSNEIYLGRGGQLFVSHKRTESVVYITEWGKIKVQPYYYNFLDYDPYTKIYIFIPFCGMIELNSCVVMGKELSLKSAIDFTDGSICWQLYNETDAQPIFTKQAKCGCDVPITALNASQMGANIVNATLGLLNTVGKTGSDIVAGVQGGANFSDTLASGGGSSLTQSIAGTAAARKIGPASPIIGGLMGLLKNTTNIISAFANLGMASKEIPQMTGSVAGLAASLVDRVPYLIYQRPLSTNPETYGHTVGYIHNKTAKIEDMQGFTICKNVDVSNISQATVSEKAELKKILDDGFYA